VREFILFRNRIVSTGSPRMAPRYSFHAQPRTFKRPPFLYCLDGILRTGRCMPAMRTQQRRNTELVEADGEDEYFSEHLFSVSRCGLRVSGFRVTRSELVTRNFILSNTISPHLSHPSTEHPTPSGHRESYRRGHSFCRCGLSCGDRSSLG